ncbi:hypothetical protein U0070_024481, partial [Myodes glareolus]
MQAFPFILTDKQLVLVFTFKHEGFAVVLSRVFKTQIITTGAFVELKEVTCYRQRTPKRKVPVSLKMPKEMPQPADHLLKRTRATEAGTMAPLPSEDNRPVKSSVGGANDPQGLKGKCRGREADLEAHSEDSFRTITRSRASPNIYDSRAPLAFSQDGCHFNITVSVGVAERRLLHSEARQEAASMRFDRERGHCGGDAKPVLMLPKYRWNVSPPAMHVLTQGSESDLNGENEHMFIAGNILQKQKGEKRYNITSICSKAETARLTTAPAQATLPPGGCGADTSNRQRCVREAPGHVQPELTEETVPPLGECPPPERGRPPGPHRRQPAPGPSPSPPRGRAPVAPGRVEGADTCSWAKMHNGIWIHSHYSNMPPPLKVAEDECEDSSKGHQRLCARAT